MAMRSKRTAHVISTRIVTAQQRRTMLRLYQYDTRNFMGGL